MLLDLNKIICISLTLLLMPCYMYCDVISIDSDLNFQLNSSIKMKLNQTGLGIATNNPSSNLHLQGTIAMSQVSVSSNTILDTTSIILADTSDQDIKITLPFAGNVVDRIYTIKKTNRLNHLWIVGDSCLIDGTNPIGLYESSGLLPSVTVISDGVNWHVLNSQNSQVLVASDNLVAYWTLDEMSGTVAYDSSGHNHHGSLENMGTGNIGFTGKIGMAMRFDGLDDQISIPDNSDLRLNNNWSISCWYKRISFINTDPGIFVKGASNTVDGYLFWYNAAGEIIHKRNNNQNFNPDGMLLDNLWVHLVFTYNDNTNEISAFKNGQFHSSTIIDYGVNTGTGILYLGRGDQYGNAYLDDVRIYNKVLDPVQIQAIYDID